MDITWLGHSAFTIASGDTDILIDSEAEWRDSNLVGSVLYPSIHRNDSFMIVENTKTTLTITSGYSIDTQDATVGSIYWVKGKGNEDTNVIELNATTDYAISNDEEEWWIEDLYPASGSTVINADHLEFDLLDDCFGIDKSTIMLVLDFNVTGDTLITDVWGGYHVEYYPEYYYMPDAPYFVGEIAVTVIAAENSDMPELEALRYTFTALYQPEFEE